MKVETIKTFVIETLGCRCPESIFGQIDEQSDITLSSLDAPLRRLLIGRRLLIYILDADDAAALQVLPELIERGKAERDRNGYNRLRVVVASHRPESIRQAAEEVFSSLGNVDEKVHLHVIDGCCCPDHCGSSRSHAAPA